MRNLLLAFTLLIITNSSCKKDKTNPVDQLPPETQIGANTFGCLVNGEVYKPSGYSGTGTPNPNISMDFFNGNNIFSINAYQYENSNPAGFLSLSFFKPVLSLEFMSILKV